jgi:hypothetical protein
MLVESVGDVWAILISAFLFMGGFVCLVLSVLTATEEPEQSEADQNDYGKDPS